MAPTSPDIDRILEAIRAEARLRGSKSRVGPFRDEARAIVEVASHGMPQLDTRHVADFLALPLDVFLGTAYRELLGREPDVGGATHYQRMLVRASLTRIEVLGRLRLSPEGRARGASLPGLPAAFLLASAYRLPLVGALAALAARALCLPPYLRDRSGIESVAVASGTWMKR